MWWATLINVWKTWILHVIKLWYEPTFSDYPNCLSLWNRWDLHGKFPKTPKPPLSWYCVNQINSNFSYVLLLVQTADYQPWVPQSHWRLQRSASTAHWQHLHCPVYVPHWEWPPLVGLMLQWTPALWTDKNILPVRYPRKMQSSFAIRVLFMCAYRQRACPMTLFSWNIPVIYFEVLIFSQNFDNNVF